MSCCTVVPWNVFLINHASLLLFQLSLSTAIATVGCLWALQKFPPTYGLAGVWIGFGVFNLLRLMGVMVNQLYLGPLAKRNVNKAQKTQ